MTADSSKLIHAHVWNPLTPGLFSKPSRREHAQFHTIACSAPECPLLARGQCVARRLAGLSGAYCRCPFGGASIERGPTPQARSFREWIRTRKDQEAKTGTLTAPPDRVVQIRDQVWLPYAHTALALHGDSHTFRGPFWVPAAEFTPELISKLVSARPQALFGGEIRDYQRETVPLFVSHLAESFPTLLAEAAALNPQIASLVPKLTKVGRRALLATVKPNVGTFDGWTWDGTYMTATSGFPPFTKFSAVEMKIKPGPKAEVKIESDEQVGPETILLD